MATHVLLIRHGETTWNVEGRHQGQADPPLNGRGKQQAEATAQQVASKGLQAIYSSTLRRADETAQALARVTSLPVRYDPRLMEIHQGGWQGMLGVAIRERWPDLFAAWRDTPWEVTMPGGETLYQVQERVLAALADIVARHPGQRVAVVAHQLPIAIIKIHAFGLNPADIWQLTPANASWEEIAFNGPVATASPNDAETGRSAHDI